MAKSIHQEVLFKAAPESIYEALMNDEQHSSFTGGPATISRDEGGSFLCHGGQVAGRNIELVKNRRIVQAWRIADWGDGVYSVVRLQLEPQGAETRLILDHDGVPDEKAEAIEAGWHARYWEPLKKHLS